MAPGRVQPINAYFVIAAYINDMINTINDSRQHLTTGIVSESPAKLAKPLLRCPAIRAEEPDRVALFSGSQGTTDGEAVVAPVNDNRERDRAVSSTATFDSFESERLVRGRSFGPGHAVDGPLRAGSPRQVLRCPAMNARR
jgi:hypothetical protein